LKSDPKPPQRLSREAKTLWRKLTAEYVIDDDAGLLLLATALECFDNMREAQRAVASDGQTVQDRHGQLKEHPAVAIEHKARAHMLLALKSLNLDLEPIKPGPGRPPGGR
jgi:P27 family predicted phage terminase small subunit